MTAETMSAGMPVEIGKIDRELKKLWDQSGGALTRASLINLAVYSETPDSLGKNTALISEITEDHACRAIVIAAEPAAQKSEVQAWISAHCHVSRAGSKQICSEQLSFSLKGACAAALLPNIVFAQLDSDLPLTLWWQEEFPAEMDPHLWARVDRVIYDSRAWKNFDAQMQRVEAAQKGARQRIVLCDLNWVRLIHQRLALAQFFDHPATHHHLEEMAAVEIVHAPGYRSTALLLVGWLAAQLDWEKGTAQGNSLGFERVIGEEKHSLKIKLTEKAGAPIGRVSIRSKTAEFVVAQKEGADLLDVSFGRSGGRQMQQVFPAGKSDLVSLVQEELMRGGPHKVYLRAVAKVRAFL